MDCDEVIGVLFSGPFPSGAVTDDYVERHLYRCDSCAEIAEGLKPAPELSHESLDPRENENLPGYHGSFGCDALVPGFASEKSSRMTTGTALARAVKPLPVRSPAVLRNTPTPPAERRILWGRMVVALGAAASIATVTKLFG